MGWTVLRVHNPLEVVAEFHTLGFPQYIKALDGNHIPNACPPHNYHPYYSRQFFHSIMLQAIADHHGAFTNVSSGWVGIAHDVCVF